MSTGSPTYGQPIPYTPPLTEDSYVAAAQTLLDTPLRLKIMSSMLSLASYATSTNATFKAQALAGIAWRDAVWTEGYSILDQVKAGTMVAPTLAAFLSSLPAMVWPTDIMYNFSFCSDP